MLAIAIENGGRDGRSIRYRSDDRKAPDTYWTDSLEEAFVTRSRRLAEKAREDCRLDPVVLEV